MPLAGRTVVANASLPPDCSVGRIAADYGGAFEVASGCLVSRLHVLTAAHPLTVLAAPTSPRISFTPAEDGSAEPVFGTFMVARVFLHPQWNALRHPWTDVAVLQLEKPVPAAVGARRLAAPDVEGDVELLGYPRPDLQMQRGEGIARGKGRLLTHDVPATFGDSGAPLFATAKDGKPIVGVHVGIEESGRPIAVALTPAVQKFIRSVV